MKKLYQGKGRRVHPAPAADAALPAAVLALASALTAEEQEVLAYLLSCGGGAVAGARPRRRSGPHPPEMGCACFGCYKSFWARWDASPNRHLIHRIIDAVEEGGGGGVGPQRRPSRRRRKGRRAADEEEDVPGCDDGAGMDHRRHHPGCDGGDGVDQGHHGEYDGDEEEEEEEEEEGGSSMDGDEDDAASVASDGDCPEKSTVGRLVRFIGEKVWGAWN